MCSQGGSPLQPGPWGSLLPAWLLRGAVGGRTASQRTGFTLVEVVCWGADISPTGPLALTLSICRSRRNGGGGGGNHRPAAWARSSSPWLPAGLCPISTSSEPHLGRGSRVTPKAGGGDSDQPEYQRCEAGMTSPRVCPLSEPCQATLPARSQAPPGRLRQQASASHSKGVPTRRAGSQPGLRPGTSLGTSFRLSGGQRCGLLGDPGTFFGSLGLRHLEKQGGRLEAGECGQGQERRKVVTAQGPRSLET